MTPRQIDLAMRGALRARVAEYNGRIEAAWLTAMLPHQKKPPKLQDLLIQVEGGRKRRMPSPAELEAKGRQMHVILNAKKAP